MDWLGRWAKRIDLELDHTKIDADLSDFPGMVKVSIASGISAADISAVFDELGSDANRKKIAITAGDGVTERYIEIEKFDYANEVAWFHVRVPAGSSSANTPLFLYYDSDHADNDAYVGDTNSVVAESVWDANFKAVYHMADGADTSHIYDSTSNDDDGTKKGANEPNQVAGDVGYTQDYDGTDDTLKATLANFPTQPLTVEAVIKSSNTVGVRRVHTTGYSRWNMRVDGGNLTVQFYNGTSWITTSKAAAVVAGNRYHIVATKDNTDGVIVYKQGVSVQTNTTAGAKLTVAHVSRISRIGANENATGNWNYFYAGDIDEVRISDIARSASWIKATKESLWDNLVTFGSEQLFAMFGQPSGSGVGLAEMTASLDVLGAAASGSGIGEGALQAYLEVLAMADGHGVGEGNILKAIRLVLNIRRPSAGYGLGRAKSAPYNLGTMQDNYTLGKKRR